MKWKLIQYISTLALSLYIHTYISTCPHKSYLELISGLLYIRVYVKACSSSSTKSENRLIFILIPGDELHARREVTDERDDEARPLLPQAEPSREGRTRHNHLQGLVDILCTLWTS